MTQSPRPSILVLFMGDIIFFIAALWTTLFLRSFEAPSSALFTAHLIAFAPLFAVWALVYLIAGLYEGRRIILARRTLSMTLLYAQTVNILIAALFFFFIPTFGISPKIVLLIYLVVSLAFIVVWRAFLFPKLHLQKASLALVLGDSPETAELVDALRSAPLSTVEITAVIRPSETSLVSAVRDAVGKKDPRFIIADFDDPRVAAVIPELHHVHAGRIRFIGVRELYEDVFGRVPLLSINDQWVARMISRPLTMFYDPVKRAMDIILAFILGTISIVLYPFIMLAIKSDDGGSIFISQDRVGQNGKMIHLYKFRSMQRNDMKLATAAGTNRVTRVGSFLRASRIDELPQLWNILRGDLSLIGPRPELPSGVALYEAEIPYYGVRHAIKPGLSGWAQLYHDNHPHHVAAVEATREKLSYDLYYLEHRSLGLDFIVALKTIAKMLTKSGA